jgi:hypothetical protein
MKHGLDGFYRFRQIFSKQYPKKIRLNPYNPCSILP